MSKASGRVHVVTVGVRHAIPRGLIEAAALAALRATRAPAAGEVEVALVGDRTMARLNRRFLGHRGPTDVLAFPGRGGARDPSLGEIVISVDRARLQARREGWPVRREVALLAVHGVLHLRGYDDRTPRAAARMRARERAILARTFRSGA